MSARQIRKLPALVALLVILILVLPASRSLSANLSPLAPTDSALPINNPRPPTLTAAQRPLEELLKPDGSVDLNSGYRGSLDPTGWRLAGDDADLRFVPTTAPTAPGDEFWAAGFNPPGMNGTVGTLVADDAGNLYAGGYFTTAAI